MKVAVIGATGLVGQVMLKVLEERHFELDVLIPVASAKSVGNTVRFKDADHSVVSIEEAVGRRPDIALFSAGAQLSLDWAPKFAAVGTFVIDNSSAWRMDPDKLLIVPEVNSHLLGKQNKIIANPNCSTIQMVVALSPLHQHYGIRRLVISTYQSFTGTGVKAVRQYESEKNGIQLNGDSAYPHQIFENCLPHCDIFYDDGYTKEEKKLVNETRKILGALDMAITATAVRVPVFGGHSESVNIELQQPFQLPDIISLLESSSGIVVQNNHMANEYPMPLMAHNKDDVFVGRIRRDESVENGLNCWIVSDNLRKGAATNAIQIAEYLIKSEIVERNVETAG